MGTFNVAPPSYLGDDPTDPMANLITQGINNQQPPIPYPLLPPAPMPPQDPGQGIPNSPLLGGNLPPTPAPYLGGVNGPEDGVSLAAESRAAKDKMAALEAAHPVLTDPKWWQRLAGGVAGGLAGWSNASGHRQPPIDIAAMEQNILHPGYADKLAQWQSQLAPLQAQAEIAGGNEAAWWKGKQIQGQDDYMKARAAMMMGNGRAGNVPVTPEIQAASGGLYKVGGPDIPANLVDRMVEQTAAINNGKYPERTATVTDPNIAKLTGYPLGSEVPISIYQAAMKRPTADNEWELYLRANNGDPVAAAALKQLNADKIAVAQQSRPPAKEPDPLVDLLRQQALTEKAAAASAGVESTKAGQINTAMSARNKEVATLLHNYNYTNNANVTEGDVVAGTHPQLSRLATQIQGINAKYKDPLQNAQDQYAQGVRNLGGTALGGTIDPKTLEYTSNLPKVPPPVTTPPPKVTPPKVVPPPTQTPPAAAPPAPPPPPKVVPPPQKTAPQPPVNAPDAPGQQMRVVVPGGWLSGTPAQVKAYLAKKGLSLAKE